MQCEGNYEENEINKDKNQQNQTQPEMHDEVANVVPHDFPAADINEFVFEDNTQDYAEQNAIVRDPIKKSTSINQQQDPKEKSMRQVKATVTTTTTTTHQQQPQQQKSKSNKQSSYSLMFLSISYWLFI